MRFAVRKMGAIGIRYAASQGLLSTRLGPQSFHALYSSTAPPRTRLTPVIPLAAAQNRLKSSISSQNVIQAEALASSEETEAKPQVTSFGEISRQDQFSSAAQEDILQLPASQKTTSQPLAQIDRRLSLTFTCTVTDCGHRSSHEFSRHAYEKGIVLVQCPNCDTRHLIADHLGWFDSDDLTQGGKYRTIEALMKAKGESVSRARVLPDGTIEIDDKQS